MRILFALGMLLSLSGCGIPVGVVYALSAAASTLTIAKDVGEMCVTWKCMTSAPAALAAPAAVTPSPSVTVGNNGNASLDGR